MECDMDSFVRMGQGLQRLLNLERFAAPAMGLGSTCWPGLMKGLAHVRTLTALDLSFNNVEAEGAGHIARAVQGCPRLSQVRLPGCTKRQRTARSIQKQHPAAAYSSSIQ
eukprot:1369884-Rhodomonas_salina.3